MPFIFISYSHKDSEYANRLADSLETKGLDVWIDERIDYGARWPQVIQEQVDRCTAFVVVMTPDSFDSEWVQNELAYAMNLRKPIFPLQLAGPIWLAVAVRQVVSVTGGGLPPASFYTRLREVLSAGEARVRSSASRREQIQIELGELQRRYDNLTLRIGAVDTDLGREMDGERRLTLEERRAELAAKRGDVVARMKQIETQLAEWEEGEQGVQPLSDPLVIPSVAKIAQDASKPKLEVPGDQRTRGGSWRLLAGLAVVVVAIAILSYRAGLIPLGQVSAPTSGSTDTPSSTQGPDVTPTRSTAPSAVPSTPVSTATSEAVFLFGDMMTVTSPIEMELVRVPAGEFWMGSDPAKDSQATEYEQPQQRVNLPEYYIGKYEVTNAQYAAFVRATGRVVPSHWENGGIPVEKENHPVVNVTWNDALAFADWLSATTGLACRLPSEAEWEKTCRGAEGLIYPWGDGAPDTGKANFNNNAGGTTSVGSYSPEGDSPYGVADMAGNVREWTNSLYKAHPYNSTDGREDESSSDARVVRGGSYYDRDWVVRCAVRNADFPDLRDSGVGFRVVCVSPPS